MSLSRTPGCMITSSTGAIVGVEAELRGSFPLRLIQLQPGGGPRLIGPWWTTIEVSDDPRESTWRINVASSRTVGYGRRLMAIAKTFDRAEQTEGPTQGHQDSKRVESSGSGLQRRGAGPGAGETPMGHGFGPKADINGTDEADALFGVVVGGTLSISKRGRRRSAQIFTTNGRFMRRRWSGTHCSPHSTCAEAGKKDCHRTARPRLVSPC